MPLANEEITQPLTTIEPPPQTPLQMLARAVSHGATPDVLERLLSMQERWEKNEARKAYKVAIAKARPKIGPIFKSVRVSMGPNKPAFNQERLDDIERAIVGPLSEEGLTYRWVTKVPENRPDYVIVTCYVEHRGGHFEESSLGGPADTSGAKNPIQAIGSTVSYLSRYTLRAALGLSTTDEDDAGAPVDPISEAQLAQLRERMEQVGQTEQRICDYYKIKTLAELPSNLFDNAIAKLDAQAKQKK